jgi:hypothetical protein
MEITLSCSRSIIKKDKKPFVFGEMFTLPCLLPLDVCLYKYIIRVEIIINVWLLWFRDDASAKPFPQLSVMKADYESASR